MILLLCKLIPLNLRSIQQRRRTYNVQFDSVENLFQVVIHIRLRFVDRWKFNKRNRKNKIIRSQWNIYDDTHYTADVVMSKILTEK